MDDPTLVMAEIGAIINDTIDYVSNLSVSDIIDGIQTVLDVVGLIPVVGEIADGINGVVSLARGNYADAALSFVAMVPVFGDAIGKGGKVAKFVATKGDDLLFQARRIVCNLVAEGCFAAGTEVLLSSVAADSHNLSDSSAGIATLQRTATRMAIESVPLGSRIATANPRPWEYDGRFAEPDQATWRQVTLELKRENGGMMDIQLLRPIDELERLGALVGSYVPMQFADLAFGGLALVKSIDPCPAIAEGEGNVVISRFVTRMAMELTELTLTDGVKLTGTSNHPVWSYDRGDWIELGELSISERLLGRNGAVEILGKRSIQSAESVFNLEIHGKHVYQVTECGLLVHNACPQARIAAKAFSQQAAENLRMLGLTGVKLANKSYNSGRKALEGAGFYLDRVTKTGRRVFLHPDTGAQVFYDSGKALTKNQRPHWHITDRAGQAFNRNGRPVDFDEIGGHIPGG